ncbi:aminopeptidase [Saccharibacillus sp. CPCC 101409]|uniref:aminopeptidase n=1 Tax=Saccharibacillus sp. CPCC 101409 TaxID=3058041 RepID=UPI002672F86B|nr:aminopeptidase [Saccharibacillus sp. CPCC 101409]MDO3408497.1 aminopeptidase [Saccharibacillus sp. CPCC 101409]
MDSFAQKLEQYAELVVKVGVNIQKGQVLHLQAPIEAAEFARLVVKKAYEAGAKYVEIEWEDEASTRLRYEYASEDTFDYYPAFKAEALEKLAIDGGAVMHIKVPDPELYRGIESSRVARATKAMSAARKGYQHYVRTNKLSWCLIKAPTRAWANKVFADLPEERRVDAMWDTIFQMNRVGEGDAVENWRRHIETLKDMQGRLNDKNYKSLHYRAPGTDLKVELAQNHLWLGGGDTNQSGVYFVANMPTEEVYTMPNRLGVTGKVTATLPLNLNGRLVEGLWLAFENGRVVDYGAESGREHLESLLDTDEGAKYLGEVALVPYSSPISRLNRIFYNTGIDENASCHFALGSAYPVNMKEGTSLSQEELVEHGGNVSLTHVDFMVGSDKLDIDGERQDGTIEPVFRAGQWSI